MSEQQEEKEEEKKTTVGKTITVGHSIDVILMRLAPEAEKLLDKLSKERRQETLRKAIEISEEKGRHFDVRLEDVIEAQDRLKLKKGEDT